MADVEMRFMRANEVRENLLAFRGMVLVALDLLGPPLIVIAAVFVDVIKGHPGLEESVRAMLDGKDFDAVFDASAVRVPVGASPAGRAEG